LGRNQTHLRLPVWGSNNFHFFGTLKKQLAGERLATDAKAKKVATLLETFDTDFFYAGKNAYVSG
jgi:hypothetical protein